MKKLRELLKKITTSILIGTVLSLGAFGCGTKSNKNVGSSNETKSEEKENKKLELKYAKGFSIEYLKDGIKKVVDAEKRTLILVPEGKEVPEEYKKEIVIKTPIKRVFIASTTQACALRAIDELDSVVATTSKEKIWQIDEIENGLKDGKIQFIGGDNPDYEKLAALKPDLTIVYTGTSGKQDLIAKLEELKLNYVVDNEYLEEDPYGRMEWAKLIGAFYDKEKEAGAHLDKAVKKVEEVSKKVDLSKKPKIVWASAYKGVVYVPKKGSYVDKMIEMAGGENVFNSMDVGEGQISMEQLYEKAKDADIFMYSSTIAYNKDKKSVLDAAPVLKDVKPVKEGNLWVFNKDYWQSIDKTDEVIIDLMEVLHPGATGENIKHFVKLEK
ncbi:ABC transporter substrate-binding protein [Haloimpatiens sp. FM7315]|uniref:ABC transporter substrate-binding protein n=1 Tax=Haloimpatiens sp. FM7315 TaxID=3298609 RepID=UPI00370C4541